MVPVLAQRLTHPETKCSITLPAFHALKCPEKKETHARLLLILLLSKTIIAVRAEGIVPEQELKAQDLDWHILLLYFFVIVFTAEPAAAEFDASGWKYYRNIRIPLERPSGIAAVALESNVLEKCRADLADIRILASDGSLPRFAIFEAPADEELNPFPVRVFRTARMTGKWTDIWIDKSAKSLTKGILLETSSKDFIRKVEIRGSDNGKEEYVISMNGMIMDVSSPLPIHSLKLLHPVNNFQYLHLRIIDDDMPPLKIESVSCYPPSPANYLSRLLDYRVLQKRTDPSANAITMILDLGDKRFPLGSLTVSSTAKDFSGKVVLSGGSSASPESWKRFHEGIIFRARKEEAIKEELSLGIKPLLSRYLKLEFVGANKAVPIEKVYLSANMRVAVFDYTKGLTYKLYYDNPSAAAGPHDDKLLTANMARIADAYVDTSTEEEYRSTKAAPRPEVVHAEQPVQSHNWTKGVGIAMLLIGLLLLFSLMLRARSLRKAEKRNSRIVYTRFN
jgi:hypothetical protein